MHDVAAVRTPAGGRPSACSSPQGGKCASPPVQRRPVPSAKSKNPGRGYAAGHRRDGGRRGARGVRASRGRPGDVRRWRRRAVPQPQAAGGAAGRRPDVADDAGRQDRPDDAGRARRGRRRPVATSPTYALGSLLSGGGSTPTPNTPAGVGRHDRRLPGARAGDPAADPADLRRSTPCTATTTSSARRSSRTTSAWARPATRRWSSRRARSPRPRPGRPGRTWAFAPCVCVTRDERWGRSYESLRRGPGARRPDGDHHRRPPGRRRTLASPTSVLATAKHFVGDGGTTYGSSTTGSYTIDQGVTTSRRPQLDALYLDAVQAGRAAARRRLGHAVVLEPADRRQGRRADQDARAAAT